MKIDLKTAEILTSQDVQDVMILIRSSIGDDPMRHKESYQGMFPKKIAEAMAELAAQRRRAVNKFSRGLDMYFTKEQLQQSSSESVASYRAERFRRAGLREVQDVCCGIGADAIALGRAGIAVAASDKDATAAHFAAANVAVYGLDCVTVRAADCTVEAPGEGALFIDPARRRGSRRIMSPDDWSPNPAQIAALLAGRAAACLKLSPAVDIAVLLAKFPKPDEIEVISLRGEAKETLFWYGKLASGVERRATSLPAEESYAGPLNGQAPTGALSAYVFDPDPALVHVGLLGAFAEENELEVMDPQIAYLTGPKPLFSTFVHTFKVVACDSLETRCMRSLLREHEVGRLEIRKRGIPDRLDALEKRLLPKTFGERAYTLLALRIGEEHLGILAEAVPDPR